MYNNIVNIGASGSLLRPCILAATGGVLSHLFYFIHGSRDSQALQILLYLGLAQCIPLTVSISNHGFTVKSIMRVAGIDMAYLTALWTSMITYRLFFHPLRRFPGPLWTKITKLYALYLSRNSKYTDEVGKLHERYGPIIRTGPNELSIIRADALSVIHGPHSKCRKGTLYEFIHYKGVHNLATIADKDLHKTRRHVWDQAFAPKVLGAYELHTRETIKEWMAKLSSNQNRPMDISLFSLLLSFDNMGRVGYSREWGAVNSGRETHMLSLLEATFEPIGKFGRLAWPLAASIQISTPEKLRQFQELANETMDERDTRKVEGTDIAEFLLQDHHINGSKPSSSRTMVYSDSQAILIGATDTVAYVMAWAFYYLARDSQLRSRLRFALEPAFKDCSTPGSTTNGPSASNLTLPSHAQLSHVDLLNGVINETFRMKSSVTLGGPRITPPEGIQVGDVWIPGGVNVFTPHHLIHRNPNHFVHPNTFIPDRWTTQPDLILDKKAFSPFLLGPFSCVGKQLALMEMRMILAATLWNFDFGFAPGETGQVIENESLDLVIGKAARCDLVFWEKKL